MANYAYSTIYFHSKMTGEIDELHKVLDEITTKSNYHADFCDIAEYFHCDDELVSPWGSIEYVSEVSDAQTRKIDYGRCFYINTETKWNPNIKLFKYIVDTFYPDIHIYYQAEEFGCDIFCKYDPYGFCPDNYYIDCTDGDYFETEKDAIEFIFSRFELDSEKFQDFLRKKPFIAGTSMLDKLTAYVDSLELDEDDYLYVYKCEHTTSLCDF